jgi:hypothetical protein
MQMIENDIAEAMTAYRTAGWNELPDLELYMDQMVTYVQKQMALFQNAQTEKLVTPAILSNSVKSGLIPRPHKKKYGKRHLAALIMACSLKQVFPVSQVEQLFKAVGPEEEEAVFEVFGRLQDDSLRQVARGIQCVETDKRALCEQVMRLALAANANRLAARMLLEKLAEEEKKQA